MEDRRREQREIDVERWATARLRLSESIRHQVAYDAMQSMLLGRTIRHAIAFTDWEGEGMGPWDSVYAHIDERGEWFVLKGSESPSQGFEGGRDRVCGYDHGNRMEVARETGP